MNRLRGRKKAKDDFVAPRPSIESESSGPFRMFGRSKKVEEAPIKEDVNIAAALPSTDDFRTSLLMTGLSARFSMLREQDDPTSMLGKASDDSVLYPKRQSRMDFGLSGGLDDIAEVGSIQAPSFIRQDSYQSADDAASITGSIMSRGKPTEGNNLFGGRQKIYKISATSTTKAGGLPGRAVYEDDVALSAFQKWRQTERERKSYEEDQDLIDSHESDPTYPTHEFNRRRETSSTTSSGPRNSTAATSVTSSQPAPSLKDWQPSGMTSSGTSPALLPERSVTRTRRLYEQGLTQDLHDQQSSALSRFDTLSRSRLGNRTPDLTPSASSPTTATADRTDGRRPLVGKASAPNMRSFSPHSTRSSAPSPAESSFKFAKSDQKPTSPPLSPPASETEEYPMLSIQPNDRGKATALGFFARPAQQYDENRFAQRQKQLQQGRETPTSRTRAESNSSNPRDGSRSSSLARPTYDRADSNTAQTEPTVEEETVRTTFLDMTDDAPAPAPQLPELSQQTTFQVNLERPDDEQHPAFRRSALPTPLSISSRTSDDDPLPSAKDSVREGAAEDSPTLGPTSGLSGMVRQHLRNVSNVSTSSSVYGAANEVDHGSSTSTPEKAVTNPVVNDWDNPYTEMSSPVRQKTPDDAQHSSPLQPADSNKQREHEEFARHLADGARRVREKLTSYVDSDQSRATSPALLPADASQEWAPPRPSAFSLLRSKSSTGSLVDRDRSATEAAQSKSKKPLAITPPSNMSSPPPRGSSLESNHAQPYDTTHESRRPSEAESPQSDKDENVHAGLKAFRQARRELQRMKEKEVRQRYQPPDAPNQAPPPPPSQPSMPILQPVAYSPSEEASNPRSRSGSRAGSRAGYHRPSERDRSGSEASSGGQPAPRPRYRAPSSAREDQRSFSPVPNGGAPYPGPAPSPGMGDFKRSPMPPYAARGDQSPGPYSRPGSATGHRGPPTPHMGSSPSAPPLPPINPRRKQMGSDMGRNDGSAPTSPYLPMSPDKLPAGRRPLAMPEEEGDPSQFRQRLRRVPNEGAGYGPPGPQGRPFPRDGPPHGAPQMPPPRNNGHHGMI